MSKIVFKGLASDGTPYLIRYPKRTDLDQLWKYINELSKEKTYISYQGEEISLEHERKFLNESIKKIKSNEAVILLVESNGKIVGISDVHKRSRAEKHTALFGISLAKDYRSKGIGKKLMQTVLEQTKKNIKNISIIRLVCFAQNSAACELYKSFGFKEYGRLPGGLLYKDKPTDEMLMYYQLR